MAGKIKIETMAVSSLTPYANNARTHSGEQVEQIARSIQEFGFTNPVLIDKDGGIIAGHGRVMAADRLGLKEVPCIRLGHLTEAQKRAYIIADNKLALNAGWDEELLVNELKKISESIDIVLVGFNPDDIFQNEEAINPDPVEMPPPKGTWVLCYIPTEKFIYCAEMFEKMGETEGVQIEMSVGNEI